MTYSKHRRHKRKNADDNEGEVSQNGTAIIAIHQESEKASSQDLSEDQARRLEIWESFREEFFEAVEQLPLSLHRSFALMKELDEQAQNFQYNISPLIHKYVHERRLLRGIDLQADLPEGSLSTLPNTVIKSEPDGVLLPNTDDQINFDKEDCEIEESLRPTLPDHHVHDTNCDSNLLGTFEKPHEILSRIGWLSSELLRSSEEKVNLAQAAYDSVDRHVRLLDQAINEQESYLTLGVRQGTHPSVLVDLEGALATQQLSAVLKRERQSGLTTTDLSHGTSRVRKKNRNRGHENGNSELYEKKFGSSGSQDKINETKTLPTSDDLEENITSSRSLTASRLTLGQDMPIDPHEPRYCYCGQVSYGEMIACDNDDCEREWFHLTCCGFTEAPKGKWYCKDCLEKGVGSTARKK